MTPAEIEQLADLMNSGSTQDNTLYGLIIGATLIYSLVKRYVWKSLKYELTKIVKQQTEVTNKLIVDMDKKHAATMSLMKGVVNAMEMHIDELKSLSEQVDGNSKDIKTLKSGSTKT